MSMAKKVFFGVLGASLLLGLVMGVSNLIAPEAVSVTLNEENVEGIKGVWVSLLISAIPGVFFGLIAAGVTALFTRKKKD